MSPQQALDVLAQATQPQMIGRLDRMGYVQVEQALQVLGQFVVQHTPKAPATPGDAPPATSPKIPPSRQQRRADARAQVKTGAARNGVPPVPANP